MILPFSKANIEKNLFIEKIWQCLHGFIDHTEQNVIESYLKTLKRGFDKINREYLGAFAPKRHTIREDKKERWEAGRMIHFTMNNRTKDSFQFAPVVPVQSVQNIVIYSVGKMSANGSGIMVLIDNNHFGRWNYGAEPDRNRGAENIERLALNDGFNCVEDFVNFFSNADNISGEFRGKIIHWTDLNY